MVTQLHEPKAERKAQADKTNAVLTPKTDIYESKEAFLVLVDLPGVDEEAISVTVERDVLTIDARPDIKQLDDYKLVYSEYALSNYRRSFNISDQINRDGIVADLKDGVLILTLPKQTASQAKKIAVRAE